MLSVQLQLHIYISENNLLHARPHPFHKFSLFCMFIFFLVDSDDIDNDNDNDFYRATLYIQLYSLFH